MTTLAATAELHRLLDGDALARPAFPLAPDGTAGRRDPSPTWDSWYCLPLTERRQLVRFMAPKGRGLALDDVAQMIGAGSLDVALAKWARACHLARSVKVADELDDWAEADAQAKSDAELYGPQEYAERLGISVANLHQRRHRALLPTEDLIISKVPIWTGETIRIWEEHT